MESKVNMNQTHDAVDADPSVTVLYNGLSRRIEFRPTDLVDVIRQRAIVAFGITQNPHLLSLWTEAGVELPDGEIAHVAGIHNHNKLLLRPGAVKGGARACR